MWKIDPEWFGESSVWLERALWSDIGMYFQLRLDRELLQIWLTVRMAGDPAGVGTADSSTGCALHVHVTDHSGRGRRVEPLPSAEHCMKFVAIPDMG